MEDLYNIYGTTNLVKIQEQIEKKYKESTILKFEKNVEKEKQKGSKLKSQDERFAPYLADGETSNWYGLYFLKRAIEPLADAIDTFVEQANTGKAGAKNKAAKYLGQFDSKKIAFITSRAIINQITHKRYTETQIALSIVRQIEYEMLLKDFQEQRRPLLDRVLKEQTSSNEERKQKDVVRVYQEYVDKSVPKISMSYRTQVGKKLVALFIEATGFIELTLKRINPKKQTYLVSATDKVLNFINNASNQEKAALLRPEYVPMVIRPRSWEGTKAGGYLTEYSNLRLIKTTHWHSKNYLEDLDNNAIDLEAPLRAINKVQETPYKINTFVLDVFKELWNNSDLQCAGLPPREKHFKEPSPVPQFDKNGEKRSKESYSEQEHADLGAWKRRMRDLYTDDVKQDSKRIMNNVILTIAEEFKIFEEIYFPHSMDFRGRMYPAPMFLNPQGNSLAKGLLHYSKGKPLGNEHVVQELAIHGANCFGLDKLSFQERVDWIYENTDRITLVAVDPFADLWWAKEADCPWTFLAFCQEWLGVFKEGYDYVSSIPIAVDATCSGLQHFSAALKDVDGGRAVNLLSSDKPADIYETVISNAIKRIEEDLADSSFKKAEVAQACLDFGLSRKASKRATMTRVYGSTQYSIRDFIEEFFNDKEKSELAKDPNYQSIFKCKDTDDIETQKRIAELRFQATLYLAQKIWDAIDDTVVAAKHGMDWLQKSAHILAKENVPITWTTVDGLKVMQAYQSTNKRKVKTFDGTKFVYLTLREPNPDKLDSRKQSNGISPNWVHANDGCHARMCVNLASDQPEPVTHFTMIHDSFACHAADIHVLNACIRESFYQLYEYNDPLKTFREEAQLLTDTELPELPQKGTLDLTEVIESDFFFS